MALDLSESILDMTVTRASAAESAPSWKTVDSLQYCSRRHRTATKHGCLWSFWNLSVSATDDGLHARLPNQLAIDCSSHGLAWYGNSGGSNSSREFTLRDQTILTLGTCPQNLINTRKKRSVVNISQDTHTLLKRTSRIIAMGSRTCSLFAVLTFVVLGHADYGPGTPYFYLVPLWAKLTRLRSSQSPHTSLR